MNAPASAANRPGSGTPLTFLMTVVVVAVLAGCGGDSHAPSKSERRAGTGCRVTRGNHNIPPGQAHNPGAGRADYYGNGRLWTVLWPRGVVVARPGDVARDGSISMKFPWWRAVRGALKITGRRLDKSVARLQSYIAPGYGLTAFQATGIIFPTEGCWEVTGTAGTARLTFVTLVRKPRPQ